MRSSKCSFWFVCFLGLYVFCGPSVAAAPAYKAPVGPALQEVSVNVLCPSKYGGSGGAQGSGTVFLSEVDGAPSAWVLTAYHVIKGQREVSDVISRAGTTKKSVSYRDAQIIQERVLAGRIVGELKFDAEIVSVDASRDIALMRIRDGEFSDVGARFYLDSEIPVAGTELYHCGAPGGKDTGGTCSLTMGIVSRIGVRIPGFGGGSKHGVFDQTDTAALGGSSGGLLALKSDGRFIGMITLGLRGGDSFHWYVPARSILDWADEINVQWLFDLTCDRPTEKDIEKIILENVKMGTSPAALVPTPAVIRETLKKTPKDN